MAEKHEIAKAHSAMTWERVKDATKNGREQINHGAAVAISKVQEVTGLKLQETLGWKEEAKKAFAEAKAEAAKVVNEIEKSVEKDVAEVKETVAKEVEEVKNAS